MQIMGLSGSVLDAIQHLGCEKIKTIGDSYMVAAGIPIKNPDHAKVLIELAQKMIKITEEVEMPDGEILQLRVGIHSGPVVAGVIGTRKFAYDLWGDTVNTASRMESNGVPGKIQISSDTYELIKESFKCEPRGIINVKGKGELETYFVSEKN